MSSNANSRQGKKRRRLSVDNPETGPSSTPRARPIENDRYYEYHSDSESELGGDVLEADRRVFNSVTKRERHTAAELTRHMTRITQQSPKHGSAILKQMLCMLGSYFPGMPKDPRTALTTRPWIIEPVEVDGGFFWYLGLEAGILANVAIDTKAVEFDVHLGEAPLPQLTRPELKTWAILARLHEGTKPPGEPFVVGVFCGDSRPTCDEFLRPFSEEAARLCESPLTVNGDALTVKPRAVMADVGMRAFSKGTVSYSSYYGCTQCTIKGELGFKSTMTFFGEPNTTIPRRTNEEFRCGVYAGTHQEVVNGQPVVTPLARLPIDIVQDFITGDARNLLHLGVAKDLYFIFTEGAANLPPMEELRMPLLQTVLANVQFPHERCTTGRNFNMYIKEWSPSMWGYFLDVVGIVVLEKVKQLPCFRNFYRLHYALAICSHARFHHYLSDAGRLLKEFVAEHGNLVGSVTSTFHQLLHLEDEVRRFGPLPLQSTEPFEAELSVLRHKVDITKAGSPVQQVATALLLRETARTHPNPLPIIPIPTNNGRRVQIRKNFLLKICINDADCWFLAPGSGPDVESNQLSCGTVVKFTSARADPFVLYGRPLLEHNRDGTHPFKDPIGLNVWSTTNKDLLLEQKEYHLEDMICKLCMVKMPPYTSFVPLPESFAEC